MANHVDITRKDALREVQGVALSALMLASRQQTGHVESSSLSDEDGNVTAISDGTGYKPWVGDTTPPGTPSGITATSGNGMIVVTWDGTLDGGIPADFARTAILIDGVEADSMTVAGSRAFGVYESGSVHTVSAIAYDDAHLQDGSSAPNASAASDQISVTVTSSDIDPSKLGITVTKATTDPVGDGVHKGDLWLKYGASGLAAAWSGTANASTSTLSQDGSVIAKQYMPNPAWLSTGTLFDSIIDGTASYRWANRNAFAITKTSAATIGPYAQQNISGLTAGASMMLRLEIGGGDTGTARGNLVSVTDSSGNVLAQLPGIVTQRVNTLTFTVPSNGQILLKFRGMKEHATAFYDMVLTTVDGWNAMQSLGISWFSGDSTFQPALSAEWWWDGSTWQAIPIAMYLDQLAVRDIQADSAVIGMLSAGIITSGLFQTASSGARVAINSDGITAYDASGNVTLYISASDGSFTANKGTITGATVRTSSSSSRTEMNDTGMTVYKSGTAYAHMGSDTTYGLKLMNPATNTLTDVAATVFGAKYYYSTDVFNTTPAKGQSVWLASCYSSPFVSLTGKVKISFGFFDNAYTDNGYLNWIDGAVFLCRSYFSGNVSDVPSSSVGQVSPALRSGPNGSGGLFAAQSVQIITGLPVGVNLYPAWAFRALTAPEGEYHNGQVRDRTIVLEQV